MSSQLADKGIDPETIDLDSVLAKFTHPFFELDTKYKQEKYFKEKLGLIVSCKRVCVCVCFCTSVHVRMRVLACVCVY